MDWLYPVGIGYGEEVGTYAHEISVLGVQAVEVFEAVAFGGDAADVVELPEAGTGGTREVTQRVEVETVDYDGGVKGCVEGEESGGYIGKGPEWCEVKIVPEGRSDNSWSKECSHEVARGVDEVFTMYKPGQMEEDTEESGSSGDDAECRLRYSHILVPFGPFKVLEDQKTTRGPAPYLTRRSCSIYTKVNIQGV